MEFTMIGLIMAIAQILKLKERNGDKIGFVKPRFIPLLNLTLGIVFSLFAFGMSFDFVFKGIMIGASACGAFDFATGTFIEEREGK